MRNHMLLVVHYYNCYSIKFRSFVALGGKKSLQNKENLVIVLKSNNEIDLRLLIDFIVEKYQGTLLSFNS